MVFELVVIDGQTIGRHVGVNTAAPRCAGSVVGIEEVTSDQRVIPGFRDTDDVIGEDVMDDLSTALHTVETQSRPVSTLSGNKFKAVDNHVGSGNDQPRADARPVDD